MVAADIQVLQRSRQLSSDLQGIALRIEQRLKLILILLSFQVWRDRILPQLKELIVVAGCILEVSFKVLEDLTSILVSINFLVLVHY